MKFSGIKIPSVLNVLPNIIELFRALLLHLVHVIKDIGIMEPIQLVKSAIIRAWLAPGNNI